MRIDRANLFDSNGGLPGFLLVEDGEANGSRRIHIRVEEGRGELACNQSYLPA
jgi:hypothetical protein